MNWSSLLGNPPYPTYAGNHAAIGTSQATILALFFGRDDIRFDHTWESGGGATRSYSGFMAMANEEERSRVYGGFISPSTKPPDNPRGAMSPTTFFRVS